MLCCAVFLCCVVLCFCVVLCWFVFLAHEMVGAKSGTCQVWTGMVQRRGLASLGWLGIRYWMARNTAQLRPSTYEIYDRPKRYR